MATWVFIFFVIYMAVLVVDYRRRRATESLTQMMLRQSGLSWLAALLFGIVTIVAILGPDTCAARSWRGMDLTPIFLAFASGALGAVGWLVFEAFARKNAEGGPRAPRQDSPASPSPESMAPALVGIATGGMLTGYRVEIWPAETEGWDIVYFDPDRGHPEYDSYAEDWTTALMQSDAFAVVWHGGLAWDGGAPPSR